MKVEQYDIDLYNKAKENLKNSYCPFSKFPVSAMLVGKSGRVYSGVNIENSSFGGTICAERTAMVKAISECEREFDRIVIATAKQDGWPCGICRQFMYEFAPDLKVVSGTDEEHLEAVPLRELLPKGFRLEE